MTTTPGSESPGSSSDSTEPVDGPSPLTAPAEPAEPSGVPAGPVGWSSQQPPPSNGWAAWSPPAGSRPRLPHQGSGQQWGGQQWGGGWGAPQPPAGGWQHGPWVRPQAPKPGVVPLRPLALSDMINGAFATLRLHWRVLVPITSVVGLISGAVSVVTQGLLVDDTRIDNLKDNPNPSVSDLLHAFSGLLTALAVTSVVTMAGTVLATGAVALAGSRAVLGRPLTWGRLWRETRPRLLPLLGLFLLTAVLLYGLMAVAVLPGVLVALSGSEDGGAALASFGMLGGAVVAAWLWCQWSLAAPAVALEKQGPVAALKRSAKLVRGAWWRVLGIQLIGQLVAALISAVIGFPFALAGILVTGESSSMFLGGDTPGWTYLIISGAGSALAATITLPIGAGVTSLLYVDQRIRRESLDIELLRAATSPARGSDLD